MADPRTVSPMSACAPSRLKLAHVSYEFPPDTAVGGIATYVGQSAHAMRSRGHHVEVFCASPHRESLHEVLEDGVIVHRLKIERIERFRREVATCFAARHAHVGFDLIESTEYAAEALAIKRQFPEVPLVVKCHTPGYFARQLNTSLRPVTWKDRLRATLGLKRYRKAHDPSYQLAMLADRISSPSVSLADRISQDWRIARDAIGVLPYMFVPRRESLEIPIETRHNVVTFTGRLEVRKGVVALADAIPQVLSRHPDTRFRLIGKGCSAPQGKGPMRDFLRHKLAAHLSRVEFIDHVPLEQIPSHLARTDICVYPSLWENFPNVCLEAMSAGRGIVASREGGMRDMLEDIDGGVLIDPRSPQQLAAGIIRLLDDPQGRQAMGARCRDKIVRYYSDSIIGVTEDFYYAILQQDRGRERTRTGALRKAS